MNKLYSDIFRIVLGIIGVIIGAMIPNLLAVIWSLAFLSAMIELTILRHKMENSNGRID